MASASMVFSNRHLFDSGHSRKVVLGLDKYCGQPGRNDGTDPENDDKKHCIRSSMNIILELIIIKAW